VQTFCEIVPDLPQLLRTPGEVTRASNLPIHCACNSAHENVILYLCDLNKDQLGQPNGHGHLPFHLALVSRHNEVSVPTLRLLVEHCPLETLLSSTKIRQAIRQGLELGRSAQFLDFCVEIWPETTQFLIIDLGQFRTDVPPLSLTSARSLCQLLPRIAELKIIVPGWEKEAFLYFLNSLKDNVTIQKVALNISKAVRKDIDIQQMYQRTLEQNSALTKVVITFAHSFEEVIDVSIWVQATLQGIAINRSLKNNIQLLCTTTTAERRLNMEFESDGSLKLNGHYIVDDRCFLDLIRHVARINHVNTFMLADDRDSLRGALLSNVLIEILKQPHGFRSLVLGSPPTNFDTTSVLKSLSSNSRLRCFCILGSHTKKKEDIECCLQMLMSNVTLQECVPWQENPKIKHYLDLNRLDRARAQGATRSELVDLLLNASASSRVQSEALGFVYGLLREVRPDIWC